MLEYNLDWLALSNIAIEASGPPIGTSAFFAKVEKAEL
jgi:hypothetical protein